MISIFVPEWQWTASVFMFQSFESVLRFLVMCVCVCTVEHTVSEWSQRAPVPHHLLTPPPILLRHTHTHTCRLGAWREKKATPPHSSTPLSPFTEKALSTILCPPSMDSISLSRALFSFTAVVDGNWRSPLITVFSSSFLFFFCLCCSWETSTAATFPCRRELLLDLRSLQSGCLVS